MKKAKGFQRRALTLLLTLAMVVTMMPMTALTVSAADTPHTHCICGADNCTVEEHGGTIEWTEWSNTTSLPTTAGYYYLSDDVTYTTQYYWEKSWDVADGTYLCLNGHTIYMDQKYINVISSKQFTLCDCGSGGGITGQNTIDAGGIMVNGTFNMYGGIITGFKNRNTTYYGGGVRVTGKNSIFNMYGGSITGNESYGGGGVATDTGTFNMYGGTITRNTATGVENFENLSCGGGVYLSKGAFNMYGGSITENTSVRTVGGVFVNGQMPYTAITLSGSATVTDNTGTDGTGNLCGNLASANAADHIFITGPLTGKIGITNYNSSDTVFAKGKDYTITANDIKSIISDDPAYEAALDQNNNQVIRREPVSHTHSWEYTQNDNTVTAKCISQEGPCDYSGEGITLTLTASDTTYTGSTYTGAGITGTEAWKGAGFSIPEINYEGVAPTVYTKSATAPSGAGSYKATITVNDGSKAYVAEKTFNISKKSLSATDFEFKINDNGGGKAASVTPKDSGADFGSITIKYYKDDKLVSSGGSVTDPGTYVVKIDVTETGTCSPATDLTDPSWTFTIAGEPGGDEDTITSPLDFANVGDGDGQTPATGKGYSWDFGNSTLTLTDFTMKLVSGGSVYQAIKLPGNAKIVLNGKNFIEVTQSESYVMNGIHAADVLTIEGTGSLTVGGNGMANGIQAQAETGNITISNGTINVTDSEIGINTRGDVIINGGTVTAISNKSSEPSCGIMGATNVKINGGVVNAASTVDKGAGIACFAPSGGGIYVSGGTVTAYGTQAFLKVGQGEVTTPLEITGSPTIKAGNDEGSAAVCKDDTYKTAKYVNISYGTNPGGNTGGSGGGGSSYVPTENYTVPVKNESTVHVDAQIKDGSAVVSEITQETLNKVAAGTGSGVDTVTIDLSGAKQEVTGITLSKKSVETLAQAAADKNNPISTVTIELTGATVVLDADTLKTLAQDAKGTDIQLVVEDTEHKNLNTTQQTALKNHQVAATFEAYFVSGGQRIHDFKGGSAVVFVKFTPQAGKDANYYHMVYVSDDGKLTRYKTRYENGRLMFTTTHFSDYAIVYDETEKNDTEQTQPTDAERIRALKGFELVARSKMSWLGNDRSVRVSWFDKNGKDLGDFGFDGYEIWRSVKRNTGYGKKPFFVTKKEFYHNDRIEAGKKYYYRVRGFITVDGRKYYTDWSLKAWRTIDKDENMHR